MGDHTKTRFKSESSFGMIVLGFTDPQLGAKPSAPPTASRRGQQLFLTVAGSQGMRVFKADAKTAFLQGSVGDQEPHCEPFAENVTGVGLGTPPMRTTAKIGVRADGRTTCVVGKSRERHDKSRMENLGVNTSSGNGVDDFLIAVGEEVADGLSTLAGVKELHDWRPWEHGPFTQNSVRSWERGERREGGGREGGRGFSLCAKYAEPLFLLDLPPVRRKQRNESITVGEVSALRGLLGQFDVACNSCGSSVASTLVVASGLRWSCQSFQNACSKQT